MSVPSFLGRVAAVGALVTVVPLGGAAIGGEIGHAISKHHAIANDVSLPTRVIEEAASTAGGAVEGGIIFTAVPMFLYGRRRGRIAAERANSGVAGVAGD